MSFKKVLQTAFEFDVAGNTIGFLMFSNFVGNFRLS